MLSFYMLYYWGEEELDGKYNPSNKLGGIDIALKIDRNFGQIIYSGPGVHVVIPLAFGALVGGSIGYLLSEGDILSATVGAVSGVVFVGLLLFIVKRLFPSLDL